MFRRRNQTGNAYEDEPSIQGVGSLLGGDGVSLDGQSVQLPSEYDDISSINTSQHGNSAMSGTVSSFRIIGIDDSTTEISSPGGEGGRGKSPVPPPINTKLKEDQESERGCLPVWITEASPWLKGIIVLSSALLVGAIVLVGVAAGLGANQRSSNIDSFTSNPPAPILAGTPSPTSPPSASTPTPGPPPTRAPSQGPPPAPTPFPSAFPTSSPSTAVPTGMPFPGQTPEPTASPSTSFPSSSPSTASPTKRPTATPSETPTALPSATPSASPSSAPTDVPTMEFSTLPSKTPSSTPTASPTAEPSSIVFYLTAGRPQGQTLLQYRNALPTLPQEGSSFLVHLGDWNSPFATSCREDSYQRVEQLFNRSSVPVYFVPGDNEYNDCPNPNQALDFWYRYLLDFETRHWPAPSFTIRRNVPNHPENFSFLVRGVLYVGINLVGGAIHNATEWRIRQQNNVEWISLQVDIYRGIARVLVVFAHADPDIQSSEPFYDPFIENVRNRYGLPTILVHRNLGVEPAGIELNFEGITDFIVLVVEGAIWPPMRVEIDTDRGAFLYNQDTWYDDLNL